MADGDIVRKITISATGENVDSTKASVDKLSAATSQLSKATSDFSANHESYADKLLKAGTAFAIIAGGAVLAKSAFSSLNDAMSEYIDKTEKSAAATVSLLASVLPDNLRAYTTSWQRTNELLAEYIELAKKAGANDVSTDFFQRETQAAVKLGGSVDSVVKSMQTLKTATAEQLGGSPGQQRVDTLQSFGNFKGNTGVDELKTATTQEEKYKAVVDLIDQAMAKGERLAALDVAKTFLGAEVAANLTKDNDYLDRMAASTATIASKNLIQDADVSRALDLQTRLDAAEATISKKWFPSQRDGLNPLVMFFKELWVEIVELVAGAFTWVEKLVNKLLSVPASLWDKFQDWRHGGDQQGPQQETPDQALARANNALKVGLQNPNTVRLATQQTNDLSNQIRPDTSKAKVPDPTYKDAYDRATESIEKYIKVTEAAATAVDLTTGEQEKLKVVAQLTAAAEKDHTPITAALAKEMDELGKRAGDAAAALEKARVASSIKFGKNTSLLTPEDVSIASQLKGLYPNVATALGSVEAQGIRTNAAMSGLATTFSGQLTTGLADMLDHTKTVGQAFQDMAKVIIRAIEEMIIKLLIVGPLMRALQGGLGGVFGIGSNATDGIGGFGPTVPGHAAGTDNSPGGWHMVGENGPEWMNVPKGSQVLPNGKSPPSGNSTTIQYHIDASGADSGTVLRIQQVLSVHGKSITQQARAMSKAQSMQTWGVG